jgi:hypothetical protein
MAHGRLAAWNPFIYGGVPFLADFQSALLYPLNLIFVVLPVGVAINWSFALHVWWLGVGMLVWARVRGLRPGAGFVGAVSAMLGGAFFLHLFAGHLSNVCTMAWVPFVLAGIDGWLRRRHAGWLALSALAAAMQIYAGHPQYVYYTALFAGIYALVHLIGTSRWVTAAFGLAAIYPVAALLGAAQLLPGIAATGEAVRSGGVAYEFSAMFSFPPENLVTAVVPWVFGNMQGIPYWGRCYLWEMSLFSGAAVVLLAVFGLRGASAWRLLGLLAVAIVLALGAHLPLHKLLYHTLPGFGAFRGASKFIFFAALMISLLAAGGTNRLLNGDKPRWGLVLGAAGMAGVLLLGSLGFSPAHLLRLREFVVASGESYLNPVVFQDSALLARAVEQTVLSLRLAAAAFLGAAVFLGLARRFRWPAWALAALAVVELTLFARSAVATFPYKDFTFPAIAEFLRKNPGDYRTLNVFNADAAMLLRSENIWGYDPTVQKRYAQLLFASQGENPEKANQYLNFRSPHPILELLRGRYALVPQGGEIRITALGQPAGRFLLLSRYRVVTEPREALRQLAIPDFNLGEEVLLEEEPVPKPDPGPAKGEITVHDFSTDHWTLSIRADRAAILLMTDSYAKGWQVESLPGSTQITYRLLPANHALRAIPLAAGMHHLRISYQPAGFREGVAVTLLSAGLLTGLFVFPRSRRWLDRSGD